ADRRRRRQHGRRGADREGAGSRGNGDAGARGRRRDARHRRLHPRPRGAGAQEPRRYGRLVRPRHRRDAQESGNADSADAEDRRRRKCAIAMYESYYGFTEKPFSLTPDPKYLYRSEAHANAFDLLQYAIRRREGFVIVTGDIGTGKTTLCRALLEQIDRTTFTALVLNPFLSEEDLLKRILQDFGVISREEVKAGRLAGVTKQELIDALYDFLLALIPLKAGAVLIIDEAQNLPLKVIEQIRILSNLETDKEKLLQIILVGQLNLGTLLRSPELRQLDQRVSIRYELKPLDEESVAAYVAHRLTIAGGSASVAFLPKALAQVHRLSGGIPRLINLICDRALLAGYSVRTNRITPDMVIHAAASLDVPPPAASRPRWVNWRASLVAGAAVALL